MVNFKSVNNISFYNSFYRLLLLDIDGTLAKEYHSISPNVKKAISEINKKINVVLVSGRNARSVLAISKELNLDRPQIAEGGSRIITSKGDNIWRCFLPKKLARQIIIDLFTSHDFLFSVCINSRSQIIENKEDFSKINFEEVSRISLLNLKNSQVKKKENLLNKVKEINFIRVKNVINPNYWNIDITDKKANKRNAVLKLKEILNIKKEEIIGVGDDYNDISFIKESGFKVAMGNAVPELKEIADYIAPSVFDDGLIEIISLIKDICRR